MSYETIEELPSAVRKAFSVEDQVIWMEQYNSALAQLKADHDKEPIIDPEFTDYDRASISAWQHCMDVDSSRSFMAQVTAQVIDSDNEIAYVDDYLRFKKAFLIDGGMGQAQHTSVPAYTIWNIEKGEDPKTGQPSIIAYGNFYRDGYTYDREWAYFLNGRNEFSIGSSVKRERECSETECHNKLEPLQWFEVSNVQKGANPRTGVLSLHIPQGEGDDSKVKYLDTTVNLAFKAYHDTGECPIKLKYKAFKEELEEKYNIETLWFGEGIELSGTDLERAQELIRSYYGEEYLSQILFDLNPDSVPSQTILFRDTLGDVDDKDVMSLILDELEAIDGYNLAISKIKNSEELSSENKDKVISQFNEIINDEADHARILYRLYLQGFRDFVPVEEDAKKGDCPAGQHEHAGIVGCHDITRNHETELRNIGSDQLDLTDEDVDVNRLRSLSTPKLQAIVTAIATAIRKYDTESVDRFMSSTMGKEFVLMILELKARKNLTKENESMNEEVDTKEAEMPTKGMSDPDAVKSEVTETVTEDATKEEFDIASSSANAYTILAALNTKIDMLVATIKGINSSLAVQGGSQQSISEAVSDAIEGISAPGNEEIPALGAGAEEKEVEEVEEKEMPEGVEGEEKEEVKETSDSEEEPKGDDEEEKKEEETTEDKSEDGKTEEKTEEKPKEESKEAPPFEKKKEEKDAEKGESIQDVTETIMSVKEETSDAGESPIVKSEKEEVIDGKIPEATESEKGCEMKAEADEAPALKADPDSFDAYYARLDALKAEGVTVSYAGTQGSISSEVSIKSDKAEVVIVKPTDVVVSNDPIGADSIKTYSAMELVEMSGKQTPETILEYMRRC